jgi:hypothetical protein
MGIRIVIYPWPFQTDTPAEFINNSPWKTRNTHAIYQQWHLFAKASRLAR